MRGIAFFEYALRQSAESGPAELRSATSRAYYGAFHAALELLQGIGIQLPKGPECHTKLRFILDNSGDADLLTASAWLSLLRAQRNLADYDLGKPEPERKSTVILNLHRAQEVISLLAKTSALQDESIGLRTVVRQYAKDVLGLTVV